MGSRFGYGSGLEVGEADEYDGRPDWRRSDEVKRFRGLRVLIGDPVSRWM